MGISKITLSFSRNCFLCPVTHLLPSEIASEGIKKIPFFFLCQMIFLDTWGNELVIEQKAGVVKKMHFFISLYPVTFTSLLSWREAPFFISFIFFFLFLIPCPGRHLVRAKTCIDRWIGVMKNKKKNSVPPRGFSSTMTTRNDGRPISVGYLLYLITSQTRATLDIKYYFSVMCSD